MCDFVIGRRGRHKNALTHFGFKLFKLKGPIVERTGQSKTIFHQGGFASPVSVVHGIELANHLMALVQKHDGIKRHVVGQCTWGRTRFCARQMPRVVFNAFAVPYFAEHFQIESGALLQTLSLHQFTHAHQFFETFGQFNFDGFDSGQHFVARRDVMAGGIDCEAGNLLANATGQWVEQLKAFNFVVKQLNAHCQFRVFCWKHIDGVTPNSKLSAAEILVIALVLHANELGDHIALPHFVARAQSHDHAVITFGLANAVNGRHSGHNDHVATLHQTFGARQTHLLNVLVDGGIFFNEQIALRHISLRLVVVVVANEILHCILGKEFPKL